MAKPVLVVVDDEDASRRALADELGATYGAHYEIVSTGSGEMALARLGELRAAGAAVPLVLADQWMPAMTGTEFLARVRELIPTARAQDLQVVADGAVARGGVERVQRVARTGP